MPVLHSKKPDSDQTAREELAARTRYRRSAIGGSPNRRTGKRTTRQRRRRGKLPRRSSRADPTTRIGGPRCVEPDPARCTQGRPDFSRPADPTSKHCLAEASLDQQLLPCEQLSHHATRRGWLPELQGIRRELSPTRTWWDRFEESRKTLQVVSVNN